MDILKYYLIYLILKYYKQEKLISSVVESFSLIKGLVGLIQGSKTFFVCVLICV